MAVVWGGRGVWFWGVVGVRGDRGVSQSAPPEMCPFKANEPKSQLAKDVKENT